ncbi:MAG: DegV family protein [Peptostreptococcus sp.]|uniref:DegV family protein n=1 Tax=Peptostreptococcus sp. TaxID=1262 RepID=UPI002FC5B455
MGIKFVVDSASDFSYEEAQNLGITFLPLTVTINHKEYRDGIDITNEEFYNFLESNETLPKTSQVTPYQFEEAFKSIIDDGDVAIAITISSKVSGTYSSAHVAAQNFPGKAFVIDSLSGSIGEKILLLYGLELIKTMDKVEDVVKELNDKREKIAVYYLLDTLEYLQKGGRVSKLTSLAGALLSVKPIFTLIGGEVTLAGKARGFKKGHNMLRDLVSERGDVDTSKPSMLSYSGNNKDVLNKYLDKYREMLKVNIDELPVTQLGSTIGTHLGPNAIGIAFFLE